MTNKLKNKVVLLTGGATGIGRECAVAYAQEGAIVAVLDCKFDDAKIAYPGGPVSITVPIHY